MLRLLLWLDDLDDCVAIWLHDRSRVRHDSLRTGLVAALVLPLVAGAARSRLCAAAVAALVALSVLVWLGAAAAEVVARRHAA